MGQCKCITDFDSRVSKGQFSSTGQQRDKTPRVKFCDVWDTGHRDGTKGQSHGLMLKYPRTVLFVAEASIK